MRLEKGGCRVREFCIASACGADCSASRNVREDLEFRGPEDIAGGNADFFRPQGRLYGVARGRLLKDARFQTSVKTWIRNGLFFWKRDHGTTFVEAERIEEDFSWEGEAISGRLGMNLIGRGHMEGTYEIPVSALLLLRMNPDGPLKL